MSKMLCALFPCSNFSTFLPVFFKLCIVLGIGEEWYGIASGIISFRNNRVLALDLCPKCFFGQYVKNWWTNFNKVLHMHCIDTRIGEDWYGIASGIISFRNNIITALDSCPKCILLNILKMNRWISIKFCICIDIYIYIWSTFIQLHFAFPYFSTQLRPLIYVQNVFLPNTLQINGYISRKFR